MAQTTTETDYKRKLTSDILSYVSSVDGVLSVTLVGSFNDRPGMGGISDIDTIVVCESLEQSVFDSCVAACERLNPADYGLAGYNVRINTTFGPLKFNDGETIVIHLMVYDVRGHIRHVLKSPFTCYDWERSNTFVGIPLSKICPVGRLQLVDFLDGRRGTSDYLSDIEAGSLSYREYDWSGENVVEVTRSFQFDLRAKGEFAFHIVKNLIFNFCKFEAQANIVPSDHDIRELATRVMKNADSFIDYFFTLQSIKQDGGMVFPGDPISWAADFINRFRDFLSRYASRHHTLHFVRHARTALNDGRFLGSRSDPDAEPFDVTGISRVYGSVFSSPLSRAKQTAEKISGATGIELDASLLEIDYGDAEGMEFGDLENAYPEIVRAWNNGEDASFPNGENSADVAVRVEAFLDKMHDRLNETSQPETNLAVTHNVFLRCLIGVTHDLPMSCWHALQIDHLLVLEFIQVNDRFSSNLDRKLLTPAYEFLARKMVS